jgi:hypothetical protein
MAARCPGITRSSLTGSFFETFKLASREKAGVDDVDFRTHSTRRPFRRPESFIPQSLGHHVEWIYVCKTGAPTTYNFEYAGWLTEVKRLGNVALRTGKKLKCDPSSQHATNAPEAEQFIHREYRKGWKLA